VLRMRIFYWKRGYREAEVDTAVVPRGRNQVGVTFFIKEGPPTIVSRHHRQPATPLLSQREIDARVVLGRNGPLNLIRLDSSRVFLQQACSTRDTPTRKWTPRSSSTRTRTAAVTLTLNPKYKTRSKTSSSPATTT
jgi:outer membrane protein assembly factor BamA